MYYVSKTKTRKENFFISHVRYSNSYNPSVNLNFISALAIV